MFIWSQKLNIYTLNLHCLPVMTFSTSNPFLAVFIYLHQNFHVMKVIIVLYCIFQFQVYCLGTILSMQISFVGFQPVQSSEHMAVSIFWLCFLLSALTFTFNSTYFCSLHAGLWCVWSVPDPCLCGLCSCTYA